jgi:CubicO group peptidase (beta-lactamase class C family)
MDAASDLYRFVLEQPAVAPPGDLWNYDSGGTELIAAIPQKAAGKPIDDLARELLFEPLGTRSIARGSASPSGNSAARRCSMGPYATCHKHSGAAGSIARPFPCS